MNRRIYFFLLAVLMLFSASFLTGCKKYEDGPLFAFSSREARVANDWKAVLISKNDIDIASDYEYIEMNFMENGKLLWKYKLTGDPTEYNFEGDPEWKLATLDEEIKITYFDDNAGDERLLYLNVLRLTADEFWFTYIDNGDRIGIHLNPK